MDLWHIAEWNSSQWASSLLQNQKDAEGPLWTHSQIVQPHMHKNIEMTFEEVYWTFCMYGNLPLTCLHEEVTATAS